MGKFLQRYGILFFFCAMMGGIIMVDSIFAIAFTDKERGLATGFSDYTMKISILQADSQEAFRQKEFLLFLQEKAQIETINVLKANSQNGELLYSNEFESMQSNALEQAPDTAVTGVYYLDGGQNTNLIFQELQKSNFNKKSICADCCVRRFFKGISIGTIEKFTRCHILFITDGVIGIAEFVKLWKRCELLG